MSLCVRHYKAGRGGSASTVGKLLGGYPRRSPVYPKGLLNRTPQKNLAQPEGYNWRQAPEAGKLVGDRESWTEAVKPN